MAKLSTESSKADRPLPLLDEQAPESVPWRDGMTPAEILALGPELGEAERVAQAHQDRYRERLPHHGLQSDMPAEEAARAELSAWRRVNPRRDRWPELREFETRIAELQTRQSEVTAELTDLRSRRSAAPGLDADALARWELGDRKGPAPEPELERLTDEIAAGVLRYDALSRATDEILRQKAEFVQRHRGRLLKTAQKATQDAHARLLAAIAEVQDARQSLVDARADQTWCAVYPDQAAGGHVGFQHIAGGLRKPMMETLGLNTQVAADAVFRLLAADAAWLPGAMTQAQKAILAGEDTDSDGAVWVGSPEDLKRQRAEREAALERYRREWGREPV
jgi:hypothetical protein